MLWQCRKTKSEISEAFTVFRRNGFTKALKEELAHERPVIKYRAGGKSPLQTQVLLVRIQNASQWRSITSRLSCWNDIVPSQMFDELLEGS